MRSNQKLNPIGTELFNRDKSVIDFYLFITQSYFGTRKYLTKFYTLKIPDKHEPQQIMRY